MKKTICAGLLFATVAFTALGAKGSDQPKVEARSLTNGMHVMVAWFPGSTNLSIFTFLPMSLGTDDAGQAQWSHLVEHLVIRSTVMASWRQANAETLPDHMRVDFYGNTNNWEYGLSHHKRWLEGVPFTEVSLETEKPRVNQECDYTARNFATHKFAIAAWAQGYRYGRTNVALKGDVIRAKLAEVQRLRDSRMVVSNRVTLCFVGGLAPATVFAEVEKQFSAVRMPGSTPLMHETRQGNLDLEWDLNARHILLIWPIPDFHDADYGPLIVAAQCLNQSLTMSTALKDQVEMMFAGADLFITEGAYFYVSASIRPNGKLEEIRKSLLETVQQLSSREGSVLQASDIGVFLSRQFTELPSPQELKGQMPPGMNAAMIEGNLGLQFGLNEYRFGAYRTTLAGQIGRVKSADVTRVAVKYLAPDKVAVCTLHP